MRRPGDRVRAPAALGSLSLLRAPPVPAAYGHMERDAEGETERRVLCRNSDKLVYCIPDVKVTQDRASSNVEKKKRTKKRGKENVCLCSPEAWNARKEKNVKKRKVKKVGKGVPVLARRMELTEGKDPGGQCAFCYRWWSVN